jgi:IMP dehydrogenase
MKTVLEQKEVEAIERFFKEKNLPLNIALTFDDVTLKENYSKIHSRGDISDFRSEILPGITLNVPFVSANMQAVTGAEMIISLEREGGLGILPQTLPLNKKLEILEKVKRADCALIENPITVKPDTALFEAKKIMGNVKSLIVVDDNQVPIGILSARDWFFKEEEEDNVKNLNVGQLMTREIITAPVGISFSVAKDIIRRRKIEKLPLVDKDGKLVGLITAHGLFYKKFYPLSLRNKLGQFIRVGSVGVGKNFTQSHIKEVETQVEMGISALLIDTARAFSVNMKNAIGKIKAAFPDLPLIGGNVSTAEGAKFLFSLGVDVVKVGQGSGHVCTTRLVGVGVPQLSAIAQCSAIAKLFNKKIISDGGIRNPGDIAKALVAGADAVMIGFLFAGTRESAAPSYTLFLKELGTDITVKDYVGAASFQEQLNRRNRGIAGGGEIKRIKRAEGIRKTVPVVGTVKERVKDLLDGLRSSMSYLGVINIGELKEKGKFVLQNSLQSSAGNTEGVDKF